MLRLQPFCIFLQPHSQSAVSREGLEPGQGMRSVFQKRIAKGLQGEEPVLPGEAAILTVPLRLWSSHFCLPLDVSLSIGL